MAQKNTSGWCLVSSEASNAASTQACSRTCEARQLAGGVLAHRLVLPFASSVVFLSLLSLD